MSTFKIAELTKSHRNSQIENNLFHWSHDFLFVFFDSTSNFYHFSDEEGHLNFKIGYLVFREMAGTVQWRFLARIWSQLSFIENALNNKKDFCAESSKSVSDLNRPPPPTHFRDRCTNSDFNGNCFWSFATLGRFSRYLNFSVNSRPLSGFVQALAAITRI